MCLRIFSRVEALLQRTGGIRTAGGSGADGPIKCAVLARGDGGVREERHGVPAVQRVHDARRARSSVRRRVQESRDMPDEGCEGGE